MSRIDDTRHNIGTGKMDNNERKELFNKFVKAGGEVISERPKRYSTFDRNKQRQFAEKIEAQQKKNSSAQKKKGKTSQNADSSRRKGPSTNPFVILADNLRIRFNLKFRSITDFSCLQMKGAFLDKFNAEYKPAVIQLQLMYLEIFKNPGREISKKIIYNLDKINPIYFELIEMAANIYDNELSSQILDEHIAFNNKSYRTFNFAEPITEFFKRIYLIAPYSDSLFEAFDKSISFYEKLKQDSKLSSGQRKRIKNSIYIVFNKLYPSLYWLFCLYNSRIIPLFAISEIDEILQIGPLEKPGTRVASGPSKLVDSSLAVKTQKEIDAEKEAEMEEAREEFKKKAQSSVSEEEKQGLILMSKIDQKSLIKKFLRNNVLIARYKSDPIIRSFIVFKEFYEEYSILLTTNKLKISVPSDRRTDTDYRLTLSQRYNEIRHIESLYKGYFETIQNYEEAILEKPETENQYFHYSKRITELENLIKNRGKDVRAALRKFFESIIDLFEILAKDMEDAQKIVQNPQEVIDLDYDLEGNKKLKDKKIYLAVSDIIAFSYAFVYRLSGKNDLAEGITKKTNQAEKKAADETKTDNKEKSPEDQDKSLFNELDDFL